MKKEQCSKDHGAVQDAKSSISCSEAAVGTGSAALSVSAEAGSSGREAADSHRKAGTNTGSVTASDVADPRTMTECRQTLHLQAERGIPGQNQEQNKHSFDGSKS